MLATLLLGAQAVSGPPAPPPEKPRQARPCPAEPVGNGEVVVCGSVDQEHLRLRPLPDVAGGPAVPRAEATLAGDLRASADVEQADVGGVPSNRIMLRLKLPF